MSCLVALPRCALARPADPSAGAPAKATDPAPSPTVAAAQVDAQLRFRGSDASHMGQLQADQEDLVRGVFQRIRLGARFATDTLEAYVQLQSASVLGEAGPVQFQPSGESASGPGDVQVPVGLQQGRLRWAPKWLAGLDLELGRMAMQFGKGRQIGNYDFHETGNAFDGLKLHYGIPKILDVDAFAVKLRRNTAHPDLERDLAGIYIAGRPVTSLQSDVYFLFITDGAEHLRLDMQTLGARLEYQPWQWVNLEAEGAIQVGTQQPEGYDEPLDHFATSWSIAITGRYNPGLPLAASLQAQQHSGNNGQSDDQVRAWRPLYPNLDEHLGLLQIVDQRNLRQYGGWFRIGDPKQGPSLTLDLRLNSSIAGSPAPAFSGPKLSGEADTWTALGTEIDARLRWPVFARSELLVASGVFAPAKALAEKVGRAWARQYLVQWSSDF